MRRLLAIVAGLLVLAVAPVQAVAHNPDPIFGGGLYAQNKVLQYRWTASGTPPLDMKLAIHAARDDSNDSRRSKAPSFDYDTGAGNVIYYGVDVPCGTNGLACFRRDTPDWFGDVVPAERLPVRVGHPPVVRAAPAPRDGCYDAENIALDELGPCPRPRPPRELRRRQRLPRTRSSRPTRARSRGPATTRTPTAGATVAAAPAGAMTSRATRRRYSTCLEVPTEATLGVGDASVPSGSMVTFTATLTSAGEGRLSNNPMNGRTVVLQRRTSSGWSDLSTMSGTSTNGQLPRRA
jgi:hypothetical protein